MCCRRSEREQQQSDHDYEGAEENDCLYVVNLAVMKPTVGYRQRISKLINAAAFLACFRLKMAQLVE